MTKHAPSEVGLFAPEILRPAIGQSFLKLNPKTLMRNPVIFVTGVISAYATIMVLREAMTGGPHVMIGAQITIWLWFTVLFANFAEAIAEGRGKARADAFRATKSDVMAKVLATENNPDVFALRPADELEPGEIRGFDFLRAYLEIVAEWIKADATRDRRR